VLDLVRADKILGEIIDDHTGGIAAEIVFGFESEMARTLGDVIMRRSMIGLSGVFSSRMAEQVASVAVRKLGWPSGKADEEIARFKRCGQI
jgi:glycerol-3-phosphate dehydrogenase